MLTILVNLVGSFLKALIGPFLAFFAGKKVEQVKQLEETVEIANEAADVRRAVDGLSDDAIRHIVFLKPKRKE